MFGFEPRQRLHVNVGQRNKRLKLVNQRQKVCVVLHVVVSSNYGSPRVWGVVWRLFYASVSFAGFGVRVAHEPSLLALWASSIGCVWKSARSFRRRIQDIFRLSCTIMGFRNSSST